jgi:hypothetical protein
MRLHLVRTCRDYSGEHLWIAVPIGYVSSIATGTNLTVRGIKSVGRTVHTLLTSIGRCFERDVDRFAEKRLGLGPNKIPLQLSDFSSLASYSGKTAREQE